MSHNCFISFKSEDEYYKRKISDLLERKGITCKSMSEWIESNDIDYIMQTIRDKYMSGTTVTIFLIGLHSSENEGLDEVGRNKQAFIIRELQATLYDRTGNPRDGLLGVVLPSVENRVFLGKTMCTHCNQLVNTINISDETVIREFSENYWLKKNECGHYDDEGHYAVLCRYSEFMNDPEYYIEWAYSKVDSPISKLVHFKDIEHKGKK